MKEKSTGVEDKGDIFWERERVRGFDKIRQRKETANMAPGILWVSSRIVNKDKLGVEKLCDWYENVCSSFVLCWFWVVSLFVSIRVLFPLLIFPLQSLNLPHYISRLGFLPCRTKSPATSIATLLSIQSSKTNKTPKDTHPRSSRPSWFPLCRTVRSRDSSSQWHVVWKRGALVGTSTSPFLSLKK